MGVNNPSHPLIMSKTNRKQNFDRSKRSFDDLNFKQFRTSVQLTERDKQNKRNIRKRQIEEW